MENQNQDIEIVPSNPTQIIKEEAIVTTLEMVMAQLNESDDISINKNVIASDLLVAKISLAYEKTGTVDKALIKKYIAELF